MRHLIRISVVIIILGLAGLYVYEHNKLSIIRREMQTGFQQLRAGTSNVLLSKQAILAFGWGDCSYYAQLLKDNLAKHGIASRSVALISKAGGAHTLLEINLNGRWILADPMNNVLYRHSFIDILQAPEKAGEPLINNPNPPFPRLVKPDFFKGALGVYLGELYLSDKTRFIPISQQYGFANPDAVFNCPQSRCHWRIEIPERYLQDPLVKNLSLLRVNSTDANLSLDFKPYRQTVASFYPWKMTIQQGAIEFTSTSTGSHRFTLELLASPIKDANQIGMRIPLPSIFMFRKAPIHFYQADFTCNGRQLWSRKPDDPELFFNSMFLPYDAKSPSAWSAVKTDQGLPYRISSLKYRHNEARIRFLPYLFSPKDSCSLNLSYTAKKPVKLLLFIEEKKQFLKLTPIPPCQSQSCTYQYTFQPNELLAILTPKPSQQNTESNKGFFEKIRLFINDFLVN